MIEPDKPYRLLFKFIYDSCYHWHEATTVRVMDKPNDDDNYTDPESSDFENGEYWAIEVPENQYFVISFEIDEYGIGVDHELKTFLDKEAQEAYFISKVPEIKEYVSDNYVTVVLCKNVNLNSILIKQQIFTTTRNSDVM